MRVRRVRNYKGRNGETKLAKLSENLLLYFNVLGTNRGPTDEIQHKKALNVQGVRIEHQRNSRSDALLMDGC